MTILDRDTIQQAPETAPTLPDDRPIDERADLESPDRGDRRRAATGVRWLRWVVLILLVVGGAVLVTGDVGDDNRGIPWAIDEGPGSHSLDGAVAAVTVVPVTPTATGWWAATEGPGSNSLATITSGVAWASTRGPGSHSLTVDLPNTELWAPHDGPGSHSLSGAVATMSVAPPGAGPFTANDGPGSHSLNLFAPGGSPWAPNEGPGSNSLES